MKCLILAAGYATRLYPLTKNFPKPLLEVKEKTIIDWLIEDLETTNKIDEYIIVSNHKFVNHFNKWQNNNKYKNKISIIDDGTMDNEHRLGAVKDISLAIKEKNINDDLLVMAGDNLLDFSLNDFLDYFEEKQKTCTMCYYEDSLEKMKKHAEVIMDSNDLILELNEKPSNPKSHWCSIAFYVFNKDDLKRVDEALNDGCLYDAPGSFINWLYQRKEVYAYKMPGHRYDIGTIDSYQNICQIYNGNDKI